MSVAIAIAGSPSPSTADPPPSADVAKAGFVVGTSFHAAPLDEDAPYGLGLLLGYEINRFVVGIGVDGSRSSYSYDTRQGDGGLRIEGSDTSFLIAPEVQFVAARWKGSRVELLGVLRVGVGEWSRARTHDAELGEAGSYHYRLRQWDLRLSWRAGPALRVWAHPRLATTLVMGIEGDHLILHEGSNNFPYPISEARPPTVISPVAQLGLLAVF